MRSLAVKSRCRETQRLQDELAQVFLLHNRHEPVAHIRAVDADVLALQVRSVKADFFDNALSMNVEVRAILKAVKITAEVLLVPRFLF